MPKNHAWTRATALLISLPLTLGAANCETDADGDGVPSAQDCDDTDPTVYPGAPDACQDGRDADCDGIDPACGAGYNLDAEQAAFTLYFPAEISPVIGGSPTRGTVAAGDFDGDGVGDLAVATTTLHKRVAFVGYGPLSGELELMQLNASVSNDANLSYPAEGAHVFSAGDLDADGDDELVVAPYEFTDDTQTDALELFYVFDAPAAHDTPLRDAHWRGVTADSNTRLYDIYGSRPRPNGEGDELIVGVYSKVDFSLRFLAVAPGGDGRIDLDAPTATLSPGCKSINRCQATLTDLPDQGGWGLLISTPDDAGAWQVSLAEPERSGAPQPPRFTLTHNADPTQPLYPSALGDLNGDGALDMAVGVPYSDTWGADTGAVYLVYGPLTGGMDTQGGVPLYGQDVDHHEGLALTLFKDLDGDALSDVLIGSPDHNAGEQRGAIYLLYGQEPIPPGALTDAVHVGLGTTIFGQYGAQIGSAGDLNADGFEDLFAVDTSWEYVGTPAHISVFLGGPRPDPCPPGGPGSHDLDGDGVTACAGDCDDTDPAIAPGAADACGDGVDADCDGADPRCGVSQRFALADADAHFTGTAGGTFHPMAVQPAGDANQDGLDDLWIIGPGRGARLFLAPFDGAIGLNTFNLMVANAWSDTDPELIGLAGEDLNGDGAPDLVIAEALNGGHAQLRVYHGPFVADRAAAEADLVYQDTVSGITLADAAVVHDMNGDGLHDLALTLWVNGALELQLFSGALEGSLTSDRRFARISAVESPCDRSELGRSVSSSADLDGDGAPDLIVGDPLAWPTVDCWSGLGGAFVFSGPLAGALTPDDAAMVIQGEALYTKTGGAVASAGDVNGDGVDDLLIGDPDQQNIHGRAYLLLSPHAPWTTLYGSQNTTQTHRYTFGYDHIGGQLTALGDLNGDGFDDVLVGAPGWQSNPGARGAHALIFGPWLGQTLYEDADWLFEGDAAVGWLGYSAVPLGDADGDGITDLAIGTWAENAASSYEAVWIVSGARLLP